MDTYEWYCVTRFFTGLGAMGAFVSSFVLAVEIAGDATKTVVGIGIEIPFALGEALVSIVGIWVKDWKDFQVSNITY